MTLTLKWHELCFAMEAVPVNLHQYFVILVITPWTVSLPVVPAVPAILSARVAMLRCVIWRQSIALVFTVILHRSQTGMHRRALHVYLVQCLTVVPRPATAQRTRLTFQSQMLCNVFVVLGSNHQQEVVLLAL
jgi:hypothetical protein